MRKSMLRRESVQTKTPSALYHRIKPTAVALAVATCFSGSIALANPVNPTVVNGTATFAAAGNILNITNSHNAIINWGSFSIGVNELTRFIQPSALSAVLNRVTGQDPSAILGALQSNGRVFLLNPNGIVFGAGAQINVAGLVASTLNLSNDDFLNNRMRFTDGAGAGSVVNQGSITGGSVYLVGNAVTNNGLITSPNGEVVLAAGNSVELVNPGTPNLRVEIVAPDNEARNLGTITAEAGRIGIYAGLINNSGTLNASSAVAEGGKILLKAKKDITLASTSVIDASGKGGGEIIAFADNNMHVDGTLNASAPVSGNGGFIETSAKNRVKVAESAFITANAPGGITGKWLIDPADFIIDSMGTDAYGSTISATLANANVEFNSLQGVGGTQGRIVIDDSISWSSANSLTLTAMGNVEVNASINNSGTGGINLYAGWDGISPAATPMITNPAASILLNAPISAAGEVRLVAGGDITQSTLFAGPIAADRLLAVSNFGSVYLLDTSTTPTPNAVNTIAGKAIRNFKFLNSKSLTVGTVGGVDGISVNNPAGDARIEVTVRGSAGNPVANLTINNNITAQGSSGNDGHVKLLANDASYGGSINVNNSVVSSLGADGGEGYVDIYAKSLLNTASSTVNANGPYSRIDFSAGGDVTLGLVSGSNYVRIVSNNGAIIDGNNGLNVSAARAELRGWNGVGTVADPLETQIANNLEVYSSNGGIGIINTGDLMLSWFSASANAAVGTTGNLTVDGGEGSSDLALLANGNLNVNQSVTAIGQLLLQAGGNMTIGNSGGYSTVNVRGNAGTTAIAGGNLSVVIAEGDGYFPATLGGFSLTTIKTGGNVLVDRSTIMGSPDVVMTVGGVININGTAAYGGRIEAGSVQTILLDFLNLTSGGFSINGIAGVVYDPVTNTGFFANGSPASIGNGLFITYSGTNTTAPSPPTDTLIVAMGESTKPPDPEKDKDVFEDTKKSKDKEAPVCK
ncbi:MAG: filamentous hemagglutinin N-terminal domain-containing protein [Betaproteobacteria bacterium]